MALTPDHMAQLTRDHNGLELAPAQEKLLDGSLGSFWLFSGAIAPDGSPYIYVPEQINGNDLIFIYHTHPNGSDVPSKIVDAAYVKGLQTSLIKQ